MHYIEVDNQLICVAIAKNRGGSSQEINMNLELPLSVSPKVDHAEFEH